MNLHYLLWPDEDPHEHIATVEIDGDDEVCDLKKMIKDQLPNRLRQVDAPYLKVWQCSIPADDKLQNTLNSIRFDATDTRLRRLPAIDQISDHFTTDSPPQTLNILVQVPVISESCLRTCYSTTEVRIFLAQKEAPPVLLPDLLKERQQFNANLLSMSPPSQGKPANFSKIQETDAQKIVWSRPPNADSTIPVTLYHPIFRRFVDDCKNHQPIAEDNKLVRELIPAMSEFFPDEDARARQLRQILKDNGIWACRSSISSSMGQGFSADGAIYCAHGLAVIFMLRGEIGSTGAEPYAQAILYYAHLDWKKSEEYPTFNFPCVIITLFGPQISFSGAIWRDRPHFQVLTPTMPLFCHQTDTDMRESLARHFGALKNAIRSLEHCYDALDTPELLGDLDPQFPDPRTYRSLETKAMVKFKYLHHIDEKKLLFFGENDIGEWICIKFVRRYSQAAHEKCAEMGFAPKLKGFEDIGAGWKMVVMDIIDEKYEPFDRRNPPEGAQDYLRERLVELHQANFVHGDVRDVNIMVRKDGKPELMLYDFDWSGIIGEVRYPINVNKVDMWRPEDASDGVLIKPDHDIAMLDHIFNYRY